MDKVTEITPNLFVCGVIAINGAMLQKLGITLIISVTREYENLLRRLRKYKEDFNINHVRIPVDDIETEVIYPYFKVIYAFIML